MRPLPLELRTGSIWAAFARLEPFVTGVIQNEFGTSETSWPDQISSFHREMWRGEYDQDLLRLSMTLPAHYDQRSTEMQKARLRNARACHHGQSLRLHVTSRNGRGCVVFLPIVGRRWPCN